MDISEISTAELKDLLEKIPSELKRRERSERVNLLRDLEKIAAERGYSLADIVGSTDSMPKKSTVSAKFKHPDNPSITWSGRGRKPQWVVDFLTNGGKIESLAI